MAYTSKELVDKAKITNRQLHYWHRKEWLVSFSRRDNDGSGIPLEWPARTLGKAIIMRHLIRGGFTPERAHELGEQYLNRAVGNDAYAVTLAAGVVVRLSLKEMMK